MDEYTMRYGKICVTVGNYSFSYSSPLNNFFRPDERNDIEFSFSDCILGVVYSLEYLRCTIDEKGIRCMELGN